MQQDDEGGEGRGRFGRRGARAYQAAVEAVFSIPVAMGLGWWADRQFGTDPTFLLVGLGIGFASFVLRLVKMRKLVEAPDPEQQEERDER